MVFRPTAEDLNPEAAEDDETDYEDLDYFKLGSSFVLVILLTAFNAFLLWLMGRAADSLAARIPRLHDVIIRHLGEGMFTPGVSLVALLISWGAMLYSWHLIGKRLDYIIWYAKNV